MKKTREYRLFSAGIFIEHLEEASFLYEQRLFLLNNHELSWRELEGFENRFESHIYGLEFGDDVALTVCRKQSVDGDYGELYVAICVFCRQGRRDFLDAVLEGLDWDDAERVRAVADALCLELPSEWVSEVVGSLLDGESEQIVMACRLIGFRRLDFVEQVATFHGHEDEAVKDAAMWALAQCGANEELAAFERPLMVQALCGDLVVAVPETEDSIHALGIYGSAEAVPRLIEALGDGALAEAAAFSLNLITGADLKEEVFIPEDIQEEDLFDDEVEAFRAGTLYPEGEWPGETVTRLSLDVAVWQAWWEEHQDAFLGEGRFRNGVAFAKNGLLDLLNAEDTSSQVRKWCGYELALQFGCAVPFDVMMPVKSQVEAIAAMRAGYTPLG